MKPNILLAAAAPLLLAAAPSWKQQTIASAAPFIDKANGEWERAIVTGNADQLSAPYANNGVFIGPDGTAVHGKTGVRTMYARRPKGVKVLSAAIHSDGRTAADPDDVYEWGSAQMKLRNKGKTRYVVGRYLTVWHRSGNKWLISHNIAF
ncbi:MAG TPA: nuclear transport factor 2 family protein [Sphingomicrobium sp.]|nr:nuclear transport factor 2 family protein [Sphingomicrobium sp.]